MGFHELGDARVCGGAALWILADARLAEVDRDQRRPLPAARVNLGKRLKGRQISRIEFERARVPERRLLFVAQALFQNLADAVLEADLLGGCLDVLDQPREHGDQRLPALSSSNSRPSSSRIIGS